MPAATVATDWLRERNNDPYGTPNSHAFWSEADWEPIGEYRLVVHGEKIALYDMRHNAWYGFASIIKAVEHALEYSKPMDPWS